MHLVVYVSGYARSRSPLPALVVAVSRALPLRLVPAGNKDGSAYIQHDATTGGGVSLSAVGRTNANDSFAQDGVQRPEEEACPRAICI